MGTVIPLTSAPPQSTWSMPTILVAPLTEDIARANRIVRRIRDLGYKVVDIDLSPDDGGSPIIQIDLNGIGDRSLMLLAAVIVRNKNTGYDRATIDDVRVCWAWSD